MCLGMFMAVLDIQVVASSLTAIQTALHIPLSQLGWIQTAYLMAEVMAIPLTGHSHPRACRCAVCSPPPPWALSRPAWACALVAPVSMSDRGAGGAGLFRRHADPVRLHRRLCADPQAASHPGHHHGRRGGPAGAHPGALAGRLADADTVLALDFPDQHSAGPGGGAGGALRPEARRRPKSPC